MFAGPIGGISSRLGPPTVAYLTAWNAQTDRGWRVQGSIYGAWRYKLIADFALLDRAYARGNRAFFGRYDRPIV